MENLKLECGNIINSLEKKYLKIYKILLKLKLRHSMVHSFIKKKIIWGKLDDFKYHNNKNLNTKEGISIQILIFK